MGESKRDTRAPWRKRRALALTAVAVAAAAFVPSFVAAHYARGPGGKTGVAWRPDKGWTFIYDAVTHSRNAQLGSSQSATERARDVWAGARVGNRMTARATDVTLVWADGPFAVPVPDGGTRPAAGNRIAQPRSPFFWAVYGQLRGGTRQMIGALDYDSGRRMWDIRDRVAAP